MATSVLEHAAPNRSLASHHYPAYMSTMMGQTLNSIGFGSNQKYHILSAVREDSWHNRISQPVRVENLVPTTAMELKKNEAIGLVTGLHANFMVVVVERAGLDHHCSAADGEVADYKAGTKLICTMQRKERRIRSRRRIVAGDRVLISGIIWVAKRGLIEDVVF